MPVVTFNKDYLYKALGFRIEDNRLKDLVAKLGFEIEGIGKGELDLEITPNRPDLLDVVGFARALKNFMHKSKKLTYSVNSEQPELVIRVGDRVKGIRPYISGLVAKDIAFSDESLKGLINFSEKFCASYGRNRRKIAMGMHNLDAVRPPLEYNAYEDEAYDPLGSSKGMRYSEVIGSDPRGKEYGHTIENDKGLYPVLKDQEGAMSLIPILNSERTKVGRGTRNIFVDITGMSLYAVEKTADIFAATLMDMGADVGKIAVKYRKTELYPKLERRYIKMPLGLAESEIGVRIGYRNMISLANKMGYEAALVGKDIRFKVPEYRLDVINEQDVVEDIAIAYGYDYIQRVKLQATQQGELERVTTTNEDLSEIMVGLGFSEMMNSFLTNETMELKNMRINPGKYCIRLRNPKAEYVTIMRTWLLPSLLRNLSLSLHEKMPQNIFELDMVFSLSRGKPVESYHAAAISLGPRSNFNDIKSAVLGLLESAGIKYGVGKGEHNSFIPGRCGEVMIDGKKAGFFGELHPEVLSNFGIEEPATAFEISLEGVYKKLSS